MTTGTETVELTVPLEDGFDDLADAAEALGDEDVNVRGYTYEGEDDAELARFVVDDPDEARRILTEAGFEVDERPAFVTAVPHKPGELARVARHVAGQARIRSSYLVLEATSGLPQLVFAFSTSNGTPSKDPSTL